MLVKALVSIAESAMRILALSLTLTPCLAFAQIDTPAQRKAEFERYCVSQPQELRAECREHARAAYMEYVANYNAMKQPEFERKMVERQRELKRKR